ncbi:hypothetical protein QAD02_023348 [Eretmocerus hayati]|uniref:Uncharacterized protein n=1 Tax=Eretmocerus hayati TaxID=131215 RepID=A0ACC2PW95_9HYME|nr:hypothetical protein QAD02_023348 [Eretmocerus hayati]
MNTVTCVAPVNIAVIKYWGKRDENLILPVNDSISATLDMDHLCAKTTVTASPDFKENRIWLNGKEESMQNPRLQNCLREIRKRAQVSNGMENWKIHIRSENNFPTAAGLASSAAGYACLATTLAKLYKVEGDISGIARAGSGSACRSIYGGFVRWYSGSDPTGIDSIARPIAPATHWSEIRILILVVSDSKKKVSSAEGMKRTLETSEFLKHKVDKIIPTRINEMQKAVLNSDFTTFAELTMKDSNEMHAACLAAYPPCVYMNDISHSIVDLVHKYNDATGTIKAAYTFDAGPNATIFLKERDVSEFVGILNNFFPMSDLYLNGYLKGIPIKAALPSSDLLGKICLTKQEPGRLKYVICTKVGDGPKQLPDSEALSSIN